MIYMKCNDVKIVLLSLLCMMVACKSIKIKEAEQQQRQTIVGGYTEFRELTDEDIRLFESTYDSNRKLTPQYVATSIVAGINYRFLCLDENGHEVIVVIFQPLPGKGEPYIKKIE